VLAAAAAERGAAERGAGRAAAEQGAACSNTGRARRCSSRAKNYGAGSSRRRARSSSARRSAVAAREEMQVAATAERGDAEREAAGRASLQPPSKARRCGQPPSEDLLSRWPQPPSEELLSQAPEQRAAMRAWWRPLRSHPARPAQVRIESRVESLPPPPSGSGGALASVAAKLEPNPSALAVDVQQRRLRTEGIARWAVQNPPPGRGWG